MNRWPRLTLAVFLSVFAPILLLARSGGSSGGGGHSGGAAGGHFSGGRSSGHSAGHSLGHAFGRLFGHGASRPGSQRSAAEPNNKPRTPAFVFNSGLRVRSGLPANHRFDSGLCGAYVFSWHNFLFPGSPDCFAGDLFLSAPSWGAGFASSPSSLGSFDADTLSSPQEEHSSFGTSEEDEPITLLQLKDGSMYGLTHYWFENGRLHYVTNYGGENSVPLDRIDFAKTEQLNADRGTPLVLPDAVPIQ